VKNLKLLFGRNYAVNSSFVLLRAAAAFCLLLSGLGFGRVIDLKNHWNDQIPLENPHKGWYHHFPDNGINKYIICKEAVQYRIEQQFATPRWVMEAGAKGGYKETQQPLLYNIEQYPSEKYDLASKYPDIIKKIQTIIAEHQLTL